MTKMMQFGKNTSYALSLLFFFLIPFSVSTPYIKLLPIPTPAVVTSLTAFSAMMFYLLCKKTNRISDPLNHYEKSFLLLFFAPVATSTLFSFVLVNKFLSVEYLKYFQNSLPTRLLYYIAFFVLVTFSLKISNQYTEKQIEGIVKLYALSVLLLIAIGIWQLIAFLFDIPFLNLHTRSHLHNVSGDSLFNFRLTSFADEPSYLGPIIIDFLILGWLLFKRKISYIFVCLLPSLIVLIFSFSFSAYANIALLIGFLIIIGMTSNKKYRRFSIISLAFIFVMLIVLYITKNELFLQFFMPVLGRFETLFDIKSHSRLYMYVMPIIWLFTQSSFLIPIFGFGPGAFDFLSMTRILPNRTSFSVSSNNMYIDILFEHGLIGFVSLTVGLILLFLKLFKNRFENKYYFTALLLFTHLLITSLYRADFVTPRFWGDIIIIFLLMRIGGNNRKKIYLNK